MILLKNRDRNPSFKKGEYVEINDAGNYPMELSVDGVCKQKTTNGKNKLPNNATSKTLNGVTFTKNSDGTVVANGTATASCFYNIISDNEVPITTTNLILSGCPLGGTSSSYRLRATYTDSSYSEDVGNSIKLKDGKVLQIVTIVITNGTTCNNLIFKPMISSDGGEYEPYTGGQPSPSPDYLQEIKTITGNLKLTSCGNNLFDKSTSTANKYINSSDGTLLNSSSSSASDFINVSENTQYTISGYGTASYYKVVTYYNSSKTFISSIKITNAYDSYSFTTPSNAKYIRFHYTTSNENQVMLNEGTTALPYEPYQGSSLNIAIPSNEFVGRIDDTYKDRLNVEYNEEDGHYHLILNKMIGKVVLDGKEKWDLAERTSNNNGVFYVNLALHGINVVNRAKAYSNYAKYTLGYSNKVGQFDIHYSQFRFFAPTRTITIEDWKKLLASNNLEIYFIIEKPYTIDLGIVDQLLTFDEITNVFSDSDLLPIINVKYYKDFEFDKILRSGYNIDEQEYEIAKKQMANGKRKRILSSYVDCIIKINLGLLDNKTYQEYKEQLDDGEFHYWSYKYNQYKKAKFILTKPSITTEYAYDDDIGINDMEITLEKSSDIE